LAAEVGTVRLIVVAGARPNFVKAGPLFPVLARAGFDSDLVFTGSRSSTRGESPETPVTFYGVEVPRPRWFLDVGEGTEAVQTGEAMVAFEHLLSSEMPDSVVVIGDVNPTLAAAIAAAKLRIPVIHLGAGLRCGDMAYPEEINRVLITHVTSLHLAPTEDALRNLLDEGVDQERIHFVGSVMAESVLRHADRVKRLRACLAYDLAPSGYVLASFHRPENVADFARLRNIVEGLGAVDRPVLMVDTAGIAESLSGQGMPVPANVRVVSSVPYDQMLALQRDADVVVTDSGGIQEEACVLGTPCVTVRDTTELRATLEVGANRLCMAEPHAIVDCVAAASAQKRTWVTPKRWDTAVSGRVVRALKRGVKLLG
jgi:UDP-N-acetylglucosamine 2-epimerase (non-hydrolysing)